MSVKTLITCRHLGGRDKNQKPVSDVEIVDFGVQGNREMGMKCNWEYFELRLKVDTTKVTGIEFGNVTLDLSSLGIADFTGSNYSCNFEHVFGQLAKLKIIRAYFPKQEKITYKNTLTVGGIGGGIGIPIFNTKLVNQIPYLGVLQQAERDGKILAGATLYVHRRGQSESGVPTGVRLSMKGVTVLGTEITQNPFVLLSGDSAKVEH
jgi:hypothetical protein